MPGNTEKLRNLEPATYQEMGGCAQKFHALLFDEADVYFGPTDHFDMDICACEPLLRARGGCVMIDAGARLVYPVRENSESIVAFRSIQVRNLVRKRLPQLI